MQEPAFFLQTNVDRKVWEEVDEYLFSHFDKARATPGDEPRYTGNRIHVSSDGRVDMQLIGIGTCELSVIARILGVRQESGTYPNGFVRKPEFVKMVLQQNRVVLHEVGGENFKKVSG